MVIIVLLLNDMIV